MICIFSGCNVMIASRKADKLETAVKEIRGNIPGCSINWTQCNIRQEDSVSAISAIQMLVVCIVYSIDGWLCTIV